MTVGKKVNKTNVKCYHFNILKNSKCNLFQSLFSFVRKTTKWVWIEFEEGQTERHLQKRIFDFTFCWMNAFSSQYYELYVFVLLTWCLVNIYQSNSYCNLFSSVFFVGLFVAWGTFFVVVSILTFQLSQHHTLLTV